MPYLTLTEKLKLQLSPGLVATYDIQPGNRVGLFWDKHGDVRFTDDRGCTQHETFISAFVH